MKEIILKEYASFWTEDNGILYCRIDNIVTYNKLDYKKAQLYIEAIVKLSHGVPMPLLIDLRDVKGSFSIAAAQFMSESLNNLPLIICEAFVLNSLAMNLLILSYKRIYDTKIPYKVYDNILDAEEYCLRNRLEYTHNNYAKIVENN
tara:strand:+ start:8628 stop:9068 length:441 start_codon:yes stop_codon:yes gene_type:complete